MHFCVFAFVRVRVCACGCGCACEWVSEWEVNGANIKADRSEANGMSHYIIAGKNFNSEAGCGSTENEIFYLANRSRLIGPIGSRSPPAGFGSCRTRSWCPCNRPTSRWKKLRKKIGKMSSSRKSYFWNETETSWVDSKLLEDNISRSFSAPSRINNLPERLE